MLSVELNERLLRALKKPLLGIADIESFRIEMAQAFQYLPSYLAAVVLGGQSSTPGMAFLAGYQAAIRCLDPSCEYANFAAFCVSEKGVKKPWDMETRLLSSNEGWRLQGRKGFVMLLPDLIDSLYILAKEETGSLACVQIPANVAGLSVSETLNAPFVKDIPHAGIVLNNISVTNQQILTKEGHEKANKPFRYWEDIHVAVAMFAWMLRQMSERDDFEWQKQLMLKKICQLIEKFTEKSDYYSGEMLDMLDDCHQVLEAQSVFLPKAALAQWQIDRLLLQMGLKIRRQIRQKLKQ